MMEYLANLSDQRIRLSQLDSNDEFTSPIITWNYKEGLIGPFLDQIIYLYGKYLYVNIIYTENLRYSIGS